VRILRAGSHLSTSSQRTTSGTGLPASPLLSSKYTYLSLAGLVRGRTKGSFLIGSIVLPSLVNEALKDPEPYLPQETKETRSSSKTIPLGPVIINSQWLRDTTAAPRLPLTKSSGLDGFANNFALISIPKEFRGYRSHFKKSERE
jgi:hypothetical protein